MDQPEILDERVSVSTLHTKPLVLVPGPHLDDRGIYSEQGNDQFCTEILSALPPGSLYRWDFVVGELAPRNGRLRFVEVLENRLRSIVDEHVRLAAWVKRRDDEMVRVYKPCHRDYAAVILASAALSPSVRELKLVTRYPVYGPGFELVRSGWNESSGIYYDEPEELKDLRPRAH